MNILEVEGLVKSYDNHGQRELVLDGLGFAVEQGGVLTIVGPSGCGKTTLLRCIAGLLPFDAGEIRLEGEVVREPPETLGVVFQDYSRSLLPWLTVARNVELPLVYHDIEKDERETRTAEALRSVGLEDHRRKRPWQLSGGMQQRVAIARALAYRPSVLLMDEPFASVDAQTRAELEDLTLRLWEQHQMTIVFITHDIDEAVYMGDRVTVLSSTPTRIKRELDIPLPRPRSQLTTKALPAFGELRSEVLRLLFDTDGAGAVDRGVEVTQRHVT